MTLMPDNRVKCPNCGAYDERWFVNEDGGMQCIDCDYVIDGSDNTDKEDHQET